MIENYRDQFEDSMIYETESIIIQNVYCRAEVWKQSYFLGIPSDRVTCFYIGPVVPSSGKLSSSLSNG